MVHSSCLWLWLQTAAFEDAQAFLVLVQGGRTLTGAGIQLHELAMGLFVQAVQGQPAPSVLDGLGRIILALIAAYQAPHGVGQLVAQRIGQGTLPIIESEGIAQAKALHKITPVQCDRGAQDWQARGADAAGRVGMLATLAQQVPKIKHIQAQRAIRPEAQLIALHLNPIVQPGLFQLPQRGAQSSEGALLI